MSTTGIPLLSGPLPEYQGPDEQTCRKCAKEFNLIFNRPRRCNHCGFSYCHNCTDYQALMPRISQSTTRGYDPVNVCAFCIGFLQVTATKLDDLKELSLSKLFEYVNAYGIQLNRVVEKGEIINAIINARMSNGCLPIPNENFYRNHSVPSKGSATRPRGLFSRFTGERPQQAPSPSTSTPRSVDINPGHHFARPDLAPDDPPPPVATRQSPPQMPQQTQSFSRPDLASDSHPPRATQQPPRPTRTRPPQPYSFTRPDLTPDIHPPPAPSQQTRPQFQSMPTPPRGPSSPHTQQPRPARQHMPAHSPPHNTRPSQPPYMNNSAGSRSSQNLRTPPPPPQTNTSTRPPSNGAPPQQARQRTSSHPSKPTVPPPNLDQLLNMTTSAISSLSVSTLKSILFNNRVNTGGMIIIEKVDIVKKVVSLVDDERKERAKRREEEEREERERQARLDAAKRANDSSPPSSAPPPSDWEKTGLCVVCQDADANIAIVDCGHLAMCKDCSDAIMASTRECPLCRTRIITENRLLRIYKT